MREAGRKTCPPSLLAVSTFVRESNSENNFAVSSAGLGEAMVRSASAMAAAGNTLDETLALIAAGNEVVNERATCT